MRYKNFVPYKMRNMTDLDVEIISIDEIKVTQDNTRLTFTARQLLTENTRQCVAWTDKKLNKGDQLQIKGWRKDEIFIVARFLRTKKAEDEC